MVWVWPYTRPKPKYSVTEAEPVPHGAGSVVNTLVLNMTHLLLFGYHRATISR